MYKKSRSFTHWPAEMIQTTKHARTHACICFHPMGPLHPHPTLRLWQMYLWNRFDAYWSSRQSQLRKRDKWVFKNKMDVRVESDVGVRVRGWGGTWLCISPALWGCFRWQIKGLFEGWDLVSRLRLLVLRLALGRGGLGCVLYQRQST